ncbi:carboxylesterase/lipase family protein [Corallococcus sp. H22C18031201]|uniref:carboxylesterase/lipase family protein n=1 Tax=Citreicoccus inhibens TaxID=2849499 RepID=UPI000E723882|nr:carboxylesterase/lipase family protein [Citreicoccus inhibens]MBU8897163.1 carboxylesterase/lipase family protein [Citreicoccus inhibens]RJS21266.1 carboxylesterase/lipase family protein [Corallococcus sp. H22C18031201]
MSTRSPVVETKEGKVQGLQDQGISLFKGIPYAKPPVGPLRWRAPERATPWTGTRDTLEFGPSPLQSRQGCIEGGGGDPGKLSEDCLYLNVYSPKLGPGAKLPVVVWIHGGAFVVGTSSVPPYNGVPLASRNVVLVTVNYRLGHLGFFAHPALEQENPGGPANFGLLDQALSLEWVRDNIAAFGGDPGNVTLMGQSAGAKSVLALFASPLVRGKGLFHKGISMSAYVLSERPVADAKLSGIAFARRAGLTDPFVTMDQLRKLPAENFWMLPSDTLNAPNAIYGDSVLPEPIRTTFESGDQLKLPLILGSTNDDSSVVSAFGIDPGTILERLGPIADTIRELYPDVNDDREIGRRMCRDFVFAVSPRHYASFHSHHGGRAWRYLFEYSAKLLAPRRRLGVPHGEDVPYFLGTPELCPPTEGFISDEDRTLTTNLVEAVVRFAQRGEPGALGRVTWDEHTEDRDVLLRISKSPEQVENFDQPVLDVAQILIPIIDQFAKPPPPALPKATSSSTSSKSKGRPRANP